MKQKLKEYSKKRDFTKTKEPVSEDIAKEEGGKNPIFVIQRHDATRLHYDFRLEDEGVLKSWAVPKGLPKTPSEKRLAIETEDHPLSYADFEGMIPKGEYGAGSVKIFDKGRFVNITIKEGKVMPLKKAIEKGHFLIYIKGENNIGSFAFTRTKEKQWLMIKMREGEETKTYPRFLTIEGKDIEITNAEKKVDGDIKKSDIIEYYRRIAPLMIKHVKGRPISLYRFPNGIKEGFFQKNIPEFFPQWIDRIEIRHDSKKVNYIVVKDVASIIYLANTVSVIHISSGTKSMPGHPDKMIFDLDPAKKDLEALKSVAKSLKEFLKKLGFTPYIMTTGGKGYHVAVPIKQDSTFDEVRAFAGKITEVFSKSRPDILTIEMRIDRRGERIFVDANRNSRAQTAIAPYSIRAAEGITIACPFRWEELETTDPKTYNIFSEIKTDAWEDFSNNQVSIKKVMKELMSDKR